MQISQKRALTIDDFTDEYGPCRSNTYKEIRAGRLRTVKLGVKTLIPRDAAEEWLAALPGGGPQHKEKPRRGLDHRAGADAETPRDMENDAATLAEPNAMRESG